MNSNLTFALFEYESTDVLIKTGDWVSEKPFIPGNKGFLNNSALVVVDVAHCSEFFLGFIRKSESMIHRKVEKNIRGIQTIGDFQVDVEGQEIDVKVLRCKSANIQQVMKVKNEILKILWNFSDIGRQSVVFAEVFYENSDIVERYLDIFLDAIETFAELDQGSTIKLFTIFINEMHKDIFFRAVALKRSKYNCFSYISQ